MIVCRPTQSGKTVLVLKIIENVQSLIHPNPKRTLYCYKEYQRDKYDAIAKWGVVFFKGIPRLDMFAGKENMRLVLDDLMEEMDKTFPCCLQGFHKDLDCTNLKHYQRIRTHSKPQVALHCGFQRCTVPIARLLLKPSTTSVANLSYTS
jgi:hypothetical protein